MDYSDCGERIVRLRGWKFISTFASDHLDDVVKREFDTLNTYPIINQKKGKEDVFMK